jgi:hypothetical protein
MKPKPELAQPETPIKEVKEVTPKAGDGTAYGDWLTWLEATWKIKNAKKAKKAEQARRKAEKKKV